jgi:hypothetical protein
VGAGIRGSNRARIFELLKGVWHKIFAFRFFSKISVPRALEYPLMTISNFSKIRGDIREWMFISGVNDTGEKREKFWDKIFKIFLLWALLSALYTKRLKFCLFFIFRCKQANVGRTLWSRRSFEKSRNDPNGLLRGPGDTDSWKKLRSKISFQTPFKEPMNLFKESIPPAYVAWRGGPVRQPYS